MKVGGKIPNEETFYERSLITFVGLRSVPVEPQDPLLKGRLLDRL